MSLAQQLADFVASEPRMSAIRFARWLRDHDPNGVGKLIEGSTVQIRFSDGSTAFVSLNDPVVRVLQ